MSAAPSKTTRRRVLVASLSVGAVALAGVVVTTLAARATDPPPEPLSASAQAFVHDLETATTIRSTLSLSPNPYRESKPYLKGVFHIRNDGAIAFDYGFQKRITFDGSDFWWHHYGLGQQPAVSDNLAPFVTPTNLAFAAIRNGGATWLPNGPHDYGLTSSGADRYDWIEVQVPGSQFADFLFFIQVHDGAPRIAVAYHQGQEISRVWFHSWDVDPTLPAGAFDKAAPPHDVPRDDAHTRPGGHAL